MKLQILQIAKQVRTWAESNKGSFPINLEGMCMRASHKLYQELSRAGFKPSFYYSSRHVAITIDNLVIDVTATQFTEYKYAKIVVTELNRYKINKKFGFRVINLNNMKLLGKAWPVEQRFWTKM